MTFELTGVERRDDAVPGGVDELCLDAELVDKDLDDVGVVADDLAVFVELVRHVFGFGPDHERAAFFYVVQGVRQHPAGD